jgi:hypothetical protein
MYFLYDKWDLQIIVESKVWRHTKVCWLLSTRLWIGVFDGVTHPHSCIQYVRMGFIMHLYSRSLFSMDNLDLQPKLGHFL